MPGPAARSCLIGMRVAREMGLSTDEQSHLFHALLLKDAGCSSNAERVFSSSAATISRRNAAPGCATDGSCVNRVAEIFASEHGPMRAASVAKQRRGSWFDRDVVAAFLSVAGDQALWAARTSATVDDPVASADRKAARLPPTRVASMTLRSRSRGSSTRSRRIRITPQILKRVPVFGGLAFDASAHHERLDGRGSYRNLPGAALSRTARILAVADRIDALSAERPYRGKLPADRVIAILRE